LLLPKTWSALIVSALICGSEFGEQAQAVAMHAV
jgi:hypothetical protein